MGRLGMARLEEEQQNTRIVWADAGPCNRDEEDRGWTTKVKEKWENGWGWGWYTNETAWKTELRLHDVTLASILLWRVWIFIFAYRSPYWWNLHIRQKKGSTVWNQPHKVVFRCLTITNQTIKNKSVNLPTETNMIHKAHLWLASLTLRRGRARSSRNRWLCSVRRRNLSSDMDCLCGREFILVDFC